jgi:UDP-glucose 4-epimerase
MRILIVGGSGFIGSHIVDALLQQGCSVVVYDTNAERYRKPLPAVKHIVGRLDDVDRLTTAFSSGIDGVVHLVSTTSPKTSNEDLALDLANVTGVLGLLDLCVKFKVCKVVFASSGGTVYGIPKSLPILESHSTEPVCPYGITKLAIEKYLHFYQHAYNLDYVVLRIANPYGARQSPDAPQGVVSVFMNKMIQGEPFTVWGDGSVIRDFVDVRDVARLFVLALKSAATGVFNAGSGIGTSIGQLVTLMSSLLDVKPRLLYEPSRACDVPAVILNCEKAARTYSWRPQIPLANGLSDLARWLEGIVSKSMAISR